VKSFKHLLFALFLGVLMIGCTAGCARTSITAAPVQEPRRQIETADFAEEIMASLLTVKHNMNSGVIGSGILVLIDGLPFMMTALHVIDHMIAGNQAMKEVVCHVDTYTREETCVDVLIGPAFQDLVYIDEATDAALVPLSSVPEGARAARMVEPGYNFRIGEEVWVIGCPTGAPNIVTRGLISGFAGQGPFSGALFTDSDVWFGTSGGGVFLSTGEYVGYVRAMVGSRTPSGREIAEGLNIFSPLPKGWGLTGTFRGSLAE